MPLRLRLAVSGVHPLLLLASALLAFEELPAAEIAVFLPLQGNRAAAGIELRAAYEAAVNRIEERGERLPILSFFDSSLDSASLADAIDRIADSDVHAIVGGFPSSAALVIAHHADSRGVPFLVDCASADAITAAPRRYVFRLAPPTSLENDALIRWMREVVGMERRIALVADSLLEKRAFGKWNGDLDDYWEGAADRLLFRSGESDFKEIIHSLQHQKPAVVVLLGGVGDAARLLRQARDADWTPYAFVVGSSSMANRRFIAAAEGAARFVVGPAIWSPKANRPGNPEFVSAYQTLTGEAPGVRAAFAYTGLLVMQSAILRAKENSREALRESLSSTSATGIIGAVKFENFGGYYQQNRPAGLALQVVDGDWEAIWPLDEASSDDTYPAPEWGERRSPSGVRFPYRILLIASAIGMTAALYYSLRRRERENNDDSA